MFNADKILEEEVARIMQLVIDCNAMAEDLEKAVEFSTKLLSAQALGLESGRTEVRSVPCGTRTPNCSETRELEAKLTPKECAHDSLRFYLFFCVCACVCVCDEGLGEDGQVVIYVNEHKENRHLIPFWETDL